MNAMTSDVTNGKSMNAKSGSLTANLKADAKVEQKGASQPGVSKEEQELETLACFAWQAMLVDPTVSVALFRELCARAPRRSEYWNALGMALTKTKKTGEAIAAFEKGIAINPKNIEAWCVLAELSMDQLDWPRAAQALKTCLELDPHSRHPSGVRARALVKKGEKMLKQATQG